MHHRVLIGFLAIMSLFLVGFSSHTLPHNQTSSGIVWQTYSLDDQGDWQLESAGQNLTQTRNSLATDSAGLIDQPSLINLNGRIPEEGLTLILDANITVGATWDLVGEIPGIKLEILGFTPYSDLRGSPGRMTLRITSASQESQDIQLIYHRPWLPDEKPERKLAISALTFPQSLDLSHKIIVKTPTTPFFSNNDEEAESIAAPYSPETLPADYDLRNVAGHVYVTPARDQGFCGSCWSYAITGVMESRLLINNLSFNPASLNLSEQYLISCNRSYFDCSGGNSTANDYLMNKYGQFYNPPGAVLESIFPESPFRDNYPGTNLGCPLTSLRHDYQLSSWNYVYQGSDPNMWRPYDDNAAVFTSNRDLIKSAILAHGAVGAGIFTGSEFGNYMGGIFIEPSGASTVNHDIVIVGWHDTGDPGTSYWIIKNSAGSDWGYSGFGYVGFTSPVIGFGAYYVDIPDVYYGGSLSERVYLPLIKRVISGTPGDWVTVFSDDFERTDLGTGWDPNDGDAYQYDPTHYSGYFWGISQCRATTIGGKSLWVVGDSVAGVSPLICGSAYDGTGRLNSMVTFGPIDLTNATSAYMKFKLWLNIQPYGVRQLIYEGDPEVTYDDFYDYGYDQLSYSANSPWSEFMSFPYYPGDVMGNTSGWKTMILNFADMDGSHFSDANLLGQNNVYIYFGASSDKAQVGNYLEGIFIDDILIKKCIGGTCMLDW
jgi:C1A family cysteine protease